MSPAPPLETYDVAVVGGGPAGIAAALASAERGARTLLVDRSPTLGGNVACAFVHTICGLYRPVEEGPPAWANPGAAPRLAQALRRESGAGAVERAGKVYVLPIQPRVFSRVATQLCAGQPGLEVHSATALTSLALGAAGEPSVLVAHSLAGAAGDLRAAAWAVIDTSGDGDAAALAGAETEMALPATLQNPSYIFRVSGVRGVRLEGFERLKLAATVARASRHGRLPEGCDSVLFRPGAVKGEAFVTLNLPKPADEPFDPLDGEQRARLAAVARERADALVDLLRREREGFAELRIDALPERIGVREGRRLVGREILDAPALREGRNHPDEVARSSWPIELWHGHERAHFEHVAAPAAIPLGALVARDHPRLGTAGRCLSATHEALGALRVVGTALATGESIGLAAALAADARQGLAEVGAAAVRAAREQSIARHGEPVPS